MKAFTRCNPINDERYTPLDFLEAIQEITGINYQYDMATCARALAYHAGFFSYGFTKDNPYRGEKIKTGWFLNPPFSLNDSYSIAINALPTKLGTVLVNANTETKWFQRYASYFPYIWFPGKRVNFVDPETLMPIKGNYKSQAVLMGSVAKVPTDGILVRTIE